MSEVTILYIEISDAYSFKCTIEYLRMLNSDVNFVFKPNGIFCEQEGLNKTVLNMVELKPDDMIRYIYNSAQKQIVFGFDTKELLTQIKMATRKDTIIMYMTDNDSTLYIQLHGPKANTGSRETVVSVANKSIPLVEYTTPVYKRSEKEPTCKVSTAVFTESCKAIQNAKYEHVIVKGYPTGVLIRNVQSDGRISSHDKFGDIDCDISQLLKTDAVKVVGGGNVRLNVLQKLQPDEIRLEGKIFNALVKLRNLSGVGLTKIYMEPGLPLKIICNIGLFGKLTIQLRSKQS